jgi:hypothetical protein
MSTKTEETVTVEFHRASLENMLWKLEQYTGNRYWFANAAIQACPAIKLEDNMIPAGAIVAIHHRELDHNVG